MKSRKLLAGFLLLPSLCLVAATVACSKPETPAQPAPTTAAPAAQSAAPASAAPTAAPAAAPTSSGTAIASAQFGGNPDLRCDLLEVKRTSGGALLVRWRLVNTGGQASTGLVAGGSSKPIYYIDWQELYYTDPAENKKYAYLTDSENNKILDIFWGNFNAGEQHLNWPSSRRRLQPQARSQFTFRVQPEAFRAAGKFRENLVDRTRRIQPDEYTGLRRCQTHSPQPLT